MDPPAPAVDTTYEYSDPALSDFWTERSEVGRVVAADRSVRDGTRRRGAHAGDRQAERLTQVWFTSPESFAKVLVQPVNRGELLAVIAEARPGSLHELAQQTGRIARQPRARWYHDERYVWCVCTRAHVMAHCGPEAVTAM